MGKTGTIKFDIEEKILLSSDKCGNGYSCTKGSDDCLCPVEDDLSGRVLFVSENNRKACPYKMSYGYSHICNCPVRIEIFKRYNR
jgi:hypothetical protein